MKKRPGANKSSKLLVAKRRERVIELQQKGEIMPVIKATLKEEGFPASTMTLWRDIDTMTRKFSESNGGAFAEARKQQLAVFELTERALLEGKASTEIVREWRSIRSEMSSLLGLNAPTVSIRAEVGNAKVKGFYAQFARATMKLKHPESWQRLWDYIEAMPDDYKLLEGNQ